jgi:hypothetical protein
MRKITVMIGIAVLVGLVVMGWQIGSCELANVALRDDMQDIASQAGTRIGFVEPRTDEDLRRAVMRKAKEHDIELDPDQVRVQRTASADMSTVYLAADYVVLVKLPVGAFTLHFTPSAGKKMF